MLILTRKLGESIKIVDEIKITFLEIKGKQLRVGIEAPPGVAVHREEIYNVIQEQNIRAAGSFAEDVRKAPDVWNKLKEIISSKE